MLVGVGGHPLTRQALGLRDLFRLHVEHDFAAQPARIHVALHARDVQPLVG